MSKKIIITILSFSLDYIKYFFLTGSVIPSLTILLFVLSSLRPAFSFGFLSYFSFLDPAYGTGTFSMSIPEVMKIFSLVSLVIMFASYILSFSLKKIFNTTFEFSLKLKTLSLVTIVSLIYVIATILVTLDNGLDTSFYYIFAVFYIVNLIALVFYFLVDAHLKTMTNFDQPQAVAPENYIS